MTTNEIKTKYFKNNENVLWEGSPDNIPIFTKADIALVPVCIFLSVFMLSYVYSSFKLMLSGQSVSFSLFGITFLLVAFYLLFGRLWYRHKRISKNLYFVTDKRVFIFNTLRDNVVCDINLIDTDCFVQKNNLYLIGVSVGAEFIYSLGLDLFLHNLVQDSPVFYYIKNTDEVLNIITKAKGKADKNDTDFI